MIENNDVVDAQLWKNIKAIKSIIASLGSSVGSHSSMFIQAVYASAIECSHLIIKPLRNLIG